MSVKMISEINATSTLKAYTCTCGAHVPARSVTFDIVARDYDGYCSDAWEECPSCAREHRWEEFTHEWNINRLGHDWDAIVAQREEEDRLWWIAQKAKEAQRVADRRRKDRKACATARRAHWIDKVNSAFSKAG